MSEPLIPIAREDNVIKLMGIDITTNKPVIFGLVVDNDKEQNCQNITLVMYAHGI